MRRFWGWLKVDDNRAALIILAAIAVAMPRWIGALIGFDGVTIDAATPAWGVFAVVTAAAMAVVEAFAFEFCLRQLRVIDGTLTKVGLSGLLVLSAVCVVVVQVPYGLARVRGIPLSVVLSDDALALVWTVAVSASSLLIVAATGLAHRQAKASVRATVTQQATPVTRHDATRDEFVTAYRANGHASVAELAHELGVNVRTAQRWVKDDENGG